VRPESLDAYMKSTEKVRSVYIEHMSLGKRTLPDLLEVKSKLLSAQV